MAHIPINSSKRDRRSIRLQNYDYSQSGAYFITICTYKRMCLLGKIKEDEMILNVNGEIAERCWYKIPYHFSNVQLDAFIIMPNHIHGIFSNLKCRGDACVALT